MRLIDADQFGVIFLQGKSDDFIDGVMFMFDKIHEAPTVERPRGEWVPQDEFDEIFKCSNCGVEMGMEFNFCPNCGADMKEGEENGN